MGWQPNEPIVGDVILYADNKIFASYSTFTKERDISKTKYTNCPNCGAPVTGPICEYCGSVLDQAEIDRQEQELAEKQRRYEELLRQWQQAQIKAELDQSIMNRMSYYGSQISQCCCDTRTQMMQQSALQSSDVIQTHVPVIKQSLGEMEERLSFSKMIILFTLFFALLLIMVHLFCLFLA